MILALALRIVAAIVARLPWGSLRLPGRAIGWLAGSVLRIRRAGVEAAMRRAGVTEPAREARAMYADLGTSTFELLWLAGASAESRDRIFDAHVVLDDDLKAALTAGPVAIAASHTANWELVAYAAARVLATRERKLSIVVKPLSVGAFDAFVSRLRRECRLELIAPAGALRAARRVLTGGGAVAMPIDQVPDRDRHAIEVPFLGAPALVDRAPATVAHVAGVPLLVVGAARRGPTIHVHLLDAIAVSARRNASRRAETTRSATLALSRFVLRAPRAWLWLHRRWRGAQSRPIATAPTLATS